MRDFLDAIFTIYMWALSSYHLFTGLLSFFMPGTAMSFYRKVYDCNPVEKRHMEIILKPWGALAIFAGIAGFSAAMDPAESRGIVVGLAILLAMRIYYRSVYWRALRDLSGISPRRNVLNIAILASGLLILLSWLLVQEGLR